MKENNIIFEKYKKSDSIWWVKDDEHDGVLRFSFDRKNIYYVFGDYPDKLTKKEKEIFDKENPGLAKLFEEE